METTDSRPNVGPQQEKVENILDHNMYQEFFDAVDEVYSLLQSQNALQIKQLSVLVSKLKELKNIPIPHGQLPEFVNCVVNYIEIVLTFISTLKDYTRQKELVLYFLYMVPYFFDKPETIREFMKEATVKILEMFMFGNFSIVSNRELLGTFNSIAIKSIKEARTAIAEKTLYYMYKLIDSLSTYGDYGLQADIMETLFRIYGSHIRGKKIKYDLLPGSAGLSEELATNISSDNFDLHVRHWLNKFNENSSLIFTLPCQQLIFGDVTIKNIQEFGPVTWLDFDLKEQIIGFYTEGKDSSWNRVIFFARNVSNVNVNRQFTTHNKVTTVTIILSKPCISEAMDSQDYCNSLSKELKIVISNEERDKITKLISHILPKIFGDVFSHSSSRVSQKLKQVYKPLRIKASKSAPRRRSITDVENLKVLSRSTTPTTHTVQKNISLPEIKYSCLAKKSIPSTSKSFFNYNKEHVQLAKRSEQNGESCHNCSFVLTEFSRTDVASDRTSLVPSRNSEVFSNRGSSHNTTRVQNHEQVQDNIVTSDLAFEDDVPLSSTVEIISGHYQRSHSCSLIAENVEFKHSEVFSSSPVIRSTHSSQLQLIENIFCSTQFENGDLKGNKISAFEAFEDVMSDKYDTAVENLIQLELEDALHHQETPRFDVVEIESQKETVTIDKNVPEDLDVFPNIANAPLVTPTNDLTKATTSQDLFTTTQSCGTSHELSVNNSKYICGMHTHENKKSETQTSSEDRNFPELSMTVNIGAASDKQFSELAVPADEEDKVQRGEIIEVFIDLTEDESDIEKHLVESNIESQLKNMIVDADVVQNTTDAEVLPVLNSRGLSDVLSKIFKHEYTDKASEEVASDKFETAVENLVQLELEAAPGQEMPCFEVVEIKAQNETVAIDKKTAKDSTPSIMNVSLVTSVNDVTEGGTREDLFAATQRCCDSAEISENSSIDIFSMHTQENKKAESQTLAGDNVGATSDEPISELAAPTDERIRIQSGEVVEVFIDLTEDEPDVEKHLNKPDIEMQLENMDLDVNVVQNATDPGRMPTLNAQELLGVLGKNSTHESTDKDDVHPNCHNPPHIETSFTSMRLSPGATSHATDNSESDFNFSQKTQNSQKASQESWVSDLIFKKSAKRLVSNYSMETLLAGDSEDKIHPNYKNPQQIDPTLKKLSIIINRMVIPPPIEISQSDFGYVQKTYMSEKASSELGMTKVVRPLAGDNSMEALAAEQGQKVEDYSEKSQVLNASFNSQSRNLKEANFIEHVDCSSIVSVSPTIITTVASVHYANNEGGSLKETTNSPVIAAHTRFHTEEEAPVVTSMCNDYDVIETVDDFSKVQRNPIIIRKEVDVRPILDKGVYTQKSPPNKLISYHIEKANSPILIINKSPEMVLKHLDLKTKETCENYVETDLGKDEILQLWDKKQDNNKNENKSDETGASRGRVLFKEGSFSYLDDMELTTKTTPEMSQTPEPIEVNSKKRKTKRKPQDELLSTKETTRKHVSLKAKKKRQGVKPPPLLYDPVASKNLREIFEKACENIFNKTAQNCRQIDPINRGFEFGDLDVAVRGVEEFEKSHQSPTSPAIIMSPKSPQLPELNTPPDLTWPEIETVPRPAINVLQHIVVPSQAPKRPITIELPPALESTPPKKIKLDENTLLPLIPVVSSHTSEITDRALSIITYVCTLANQRNEAATTNLGLIMDFIDKLK